MSCDILPPTPVDSAGDCSSAEESNDDSSVDEKEFNELGSSDQTEDPLFLAKSDTLHTSVINEMKKNGLFKKLLEKKPLPPLPDRSTRLESNIVQETITEESPSREFEPDVNMRSPPIPPHREPPDSSGDKYADADPARKSALITLEKLVVEIGQKEEYFIKVLGLMVRVS